MWPTGHPLCNFLITSSEKLLAVFTSVRFFIVRILFDEITVVTRFLIFGFGERVSCPIQIDNKYKQNSYNNNNKE